MRWSLKKETEEDTWYAWLPQNATFSTVSEEGWEWSDSSDILYREVFLFLNSALVFHILEYFLLLENIVEN